MQSSSLYTLTHRPLVLLKRTSFFITLYFHLYARRSQNNFQLFEFCQEGGRLRNDWYYFDFEIGLVPLLRKISLKLYLLWLHWALWPLASFGWLSAWKCFCRPHHPSLLQLTRLTIFVNAHCNTAWSSIQESIITARHSRWPVSNWMCHIARHVKKSWCMG